MIRRLLIANRGEIAVRIARTARRLGIETVGVYSDPDSNALHVDVVDVAISLQGSAPADSYLCADRVVAIALAEGCDAIHPGYGFLAENAAFAQQVIDAGLCWVGPTPANIAVLGDKVAAKRAAVAAGVPTTEIIEVCDGAVPDNVPMPILVKAAAGGGGRGMRIVRDVRDLAEAIDGASREALAAFGDGTVFLEPFIEHGRHVEVQIIGDSRGNLIHLGERECSLQRRNQKVLEEAPSAGITEDVRQQLTNGALRLAQAVNYQNAGTVEFLVSDDGTICFLEVNTRIQVEHPVTEAVTGLDLIELQLVVAAGDPLPLTQDDVTITGHAIEVRLVAEDPSQDWMPSTGLVDVFDLAEHGDVRVDTGIREGTTVSVHYDSLLAKVIAHAPTRLAAAARLASALRSSQVTGVRTNLGCLSAILSEPDFLAGVTPTSYLGQHPDVVGVNGVGESMAIAGLVNSERLAHLLGAVFAREDRDRRADVVTGFAPSGWRNLRTQGQRVVLCLNDEEHALEYVRTFVGADVLVGAWPEPQEDGSLAEDCRRAVSVKILARDTNRQILEIDGRRQIIGTRFGEGTADRTCEEIIHTRSRRGALTWVVPEPLPVPVDNQLGGGPICALPGKVVGVHVEVGQHVRAGELLMVVEAMKMEHRVEAAAAATVTDVFFTVGASVDTGDVLVGLESLEED